jgi:hypothetical protein
MRAVTSFQDVQIVLNKLLNWQNSVMTQDLNRNMLRITNAGPAQDPNDYVILSQLPQAVVAPSTTQTTVTIVFSSTGAVSVGQSSAPYVVGRGRAGATPWEVHLTATTPPTGGALTANLQLNGANMLSTDISLPAGQATPVVASNFVTPVPNLPYLGQIVPTITLASGAALVTISLVIRLNPIPLT